jgi:hypothetical protein
MNPIYTDGAGNYYQLQATNADGTLVVNQRNPDGFQTLNSQPAGFVPGAFAVAPGLTDLGGGVWVAGALVDPV